MAAGIGPFLSSHMRFFDLMVLPLPYEDGRSQIDVSVFEGCIFDFAGNPPQDHILMAWDNSPEALAAARAARPIASAVDLTEICIINPTPVGDDRSDPGGDLARYLARYDANVKVTVSAKLKFDVATQLVQIANEKGADLVVMGAYGHSRLREAILGGATRTMLRQAKVPVLLAH